MGVNKGSETLAHLKKLSRADVAAILRGLYEAKRSTNELNMTQPTIDGDSNNIAFVIANKSDNKSASLGTYYRDWAYCGLKVVPVVDGDVRPTAKQATNERIAKREKSKILGHVLMKEAHTLKRQLAVGTHSSEEAGKIRGLILDKERRSRSKLSAAEAKMPADFAENDLCVRSTNDAGGFVSPVLKAKFQADAAIIGRFINGETLMAITNDSDMPILAGDEFIALKEYTRDGKMTLVSTSKHTLQQLLEYLPDESKDFVELEDASCPLFDRINCRKTRALMMVMLGCDVYGTGIKGVGPKALRQITEKISGSIEAGDGDSKSELFYRALLDYTTSETRLGLDVVKTLMQAIIFEPINHVSCADDEQMQSTATEFDHCYFGAKEPTRLPEYLLDFASPNTDIDDGPTVLLCKGVGDRSHLFLQKTGYNKCHGCAKVVCSTCADTIDCIDSVSGKKKKRHYCLNCYAIQVLVPSNTGSGYFRRFTNMKNELKDRYKFDNVEELSFDEVEEAYDAALQSIAIHQQHVVKYPLYPTSQLHNPTEWKPVAEIEFCKGGAFVSDPALKDHIPGLLSLFASFVTYDKKQHTEWKNEPTVYDALPAMLIDFATNSRVDSGYRLLERCVRHSHDPRMQSLFDSKADVIQLLDGSVGFRIAAQVPASMKSSVYSAAVAHTTQDILSVECGCKSGSKGDDKVVCVHILPIMNKLTHLMYEGLAEHILIELSSGYACLRENWTNDASVSVKDSVFILMEAAGDTVSADDRKDLDLEGLLDRFATGTERNKAWGRSKGRSNPSKMGPITQMTFDSPAKLEKNMKSLNNKPDAPTEEDEVDDHIEGLDSFPLLNSPQYIQAKLCMDAAGLNNVNSTRIGFKLLERRANTDMQQMSCNEVLKLRSTLLKEWAYLAEESKQRLVRMSPTKLNNILQAQSPKAGSPTNPAVNVSTPPVLTRKRGRDLPTNKPTKKRRPMPHSRCC